MPHYLVVGGGITGLAAAAHLRERAPAAEITVLEGSDRVGGKLRGEQVAGRTVDVGAEAVLARRPEALDLIDRVGLGELVVHPTGASAQVWSRGALHPMPRRTLMGVPADPESLRGLLTDDEVARARAESTGGEAGGAGPSPGPFPGRSPDVSVGELVAARLGPSVVDRLVEPLLGGVYAGHARRISARAALPQLWAAAGRGEPLTAAVDALLPGATDGTQARPATPVFATLRGGLHQLPAALAARLTGRGVVIRTGTIVRELHAVPASHDHPDGGYEVVTGPRSAPTTYRADRVVLALPPAPAARLLTGLAPEAARLLAGVETASMAVVTLALPTAAVGELPGSGFLVPPVEDSTIKAATFSATKWDWVRELGRGAGPAGEDLTFLRASIGRHREEASLQRPDHELVGAALVDLGLALRRDLPAPRDAHVQRWGGGLPQYAVGHVDLVEQVRAAVAAVPGLAVCGATYDGVGIPACIASARRAATQITEAVTQFTEGECTP